ncbi:hypothetical protein [Halobellus sp. H-GB7]|uniref:hypothetical protein n=1 Tax=Halobellus sp. H-GB7 TaxID=3069756 RepID=UPI0027B6C955|nr:hypothetical protein [Halobellus sp. H-GB7]MDQ2053221.1 hypothetical protein [Halobellus sp. H-GB7]
MHHRLSHGGETIIVIVEDHMVALAAGFSLLTLYGPGAVVGGGLLMYAAFAITAE